MTDNVIHLAERRGKVEIDAMASVLRREAMLLDEGAQEAADNDNPHTSQTLGAMAHILNLHAKEMLETGKIQELDDFEENPF